MDKRIFLLAALAFSAVACCDDDDPTPGPGIQIDAGPDQGDAAVDSEVPSIDSGTDAGVTPAKGAPGCFAGKPSSNTEFLNACAEGYREFNNSARLQGYTGTLPPL